MEVYDWFHVKPDIALSLGHDYMVNCRKRTWKSFRNLIQPHPNLKPKVMIQLTHSNFLEENDIINHLGFPVTPSFSPLCAAHFLLSSQTLYSHYSRYVPNSLSFYTLLLVNSLSFSLSLSLILPTLYSPLSLTSQVEN